MPDPTPDPVMAALMDVQGLGGGWRDTAALLRDTIAAQRALLAAWRADHYVREHPSGWVQACRDDAASGHGPCQLAERTRRLGVEGAG